MKHGMLHCVMALSCVQLDGIIKMACLNLGNGEVLSLEGIIKVGGGR